MSRPTHHRNPGITIVTLAVSFLPFISGCVDPPPNPLPIERGSDFNLPPDRRPSPERYREVSELLRSAEGRVSAAIFDLDSRLVFAHEGGDRFELASVAKIYILAAYLDKLAQEGRGPGPEEFELMRAMI